MHGVAPDVRPQLADGIGTQSIEDVHHHQPGWFGHTHDGGHLLRPSASQPQAPPPPGARLRPPPRDGSAPGPAESRSGTNRETGSPGECVDGRISTTVSRVPSPRSRTRAKRCSAEAFGGGTNSPFRPCPWLHPPHEIDRGPGNFCTASSPTKSTFPGGSTSDISAPEMLTPERSANSRSTRWRPVRQIRREQNFDASTLKSGPPVAVNRSQL